LKHRASNLTRALVFIGAVLAVLHAQAQERYGQLHRFWEAAVAPVGDRFAYVGHRDAVDIGPNELITMDSRDPQATVRSVPTESGLMQGSQHDIAWSPDGSRIVFLGLDTSGQDAAYLTLLSTNSVQRICFLKGEASSPRWSPDGKTIAILFAENAVNGTGPLAAAVRDTGIVEDRGAVQRIALLDESTSRLHQVTPSNLNVFEFCWAPDGRSIAAVAAPPPSNNNWYIACLYRIDLSTGAITKLLAPEMQIADPRWSPDGSLIAFIGGLMSDEVTPGGDIYVLPATGGHPRNLTSAIPVSPCWLQWSLDSRVIHFVAVDSGGSAIGTVDLSSSQVTRIWHGSEYLSAAYGSSVPTMSLSNDGRSSVVIRSSFDNPPELWTGSIGKWQQVTRLNSSLKRNWGSAISVRWKSDSLTIQGWMIPPLHVDSAGLSPMVVRLHGGPAGTTISKWPDDLTSLLVGAGYFVFLPNIRGSFGCGEAFIRANVMDIGYGDFRDILTGTEAMVKQFQTDPHRVGIMGWSYGGYMTMWAVTQTDRFRAAVAGAGIADFLSYFAQTQVSRWATPYFGGVVYDIPESYIRSSPINFIKQAKTPTLILVGEKDKECPPPQSYEFWRGLQHMGVKTQLCVYPNAGHGLYGAQWQDRCQRTLEWFNDNMR
jgi:dipeptidyl aminopeptidase/acylaminoacyl peptidase